MDHTARLGIIPHMADLDALDDRVKDLRCQFCRRILVLKHFGDSVLLFMFGSGENSHIAPG